MSTGLIVTLVILAILVAATIALYFVGKRMQKKQEDAQAQIDANKQTVPMLIIDKKRMKIMEADLPPQVKENIPWYSRRAKAGIVKVKVGPQITNLIADDRIFEYIPLRKEVRGTVSGIYLTDVRGVRGQQLVSDQAGKKKNWFQRTMDKIREKGGAGPVK